MQKSFLFPGCGARLCAGLVFFFELVLALVARGRFFLLVKWLALRAGQR